jgi:hypothetical protein
MGSEILGIILDLIVLGFLGGTIFYAVRLSRSLEVFRDSRAEFGSLMEALSRNITEAQRAIEGLKAASHTAGRELQEVLDEAVHLADEMRLINAAGNNLATRLENLAEKNRKIVQPQDSAAMFSEKTSEPIPKTFKAPLPPEKPGFAIQDKDFTGDFEASNEEAGAYAASGFKSQAERELYEALQKNQKTGGGQF